MCAHIGQKRHIYPPSINRLLFDSRHPPLLPQVDGGGCYREKFFLILFFLQFDFYSYFIFLFFRFRYRTCLIFAFWLYAHDFDFLSSNIDSFWLCVIIFFDSFNFCSIFLVWFFALYILDSMFFDSIFRLVFTRINFDLFQRCRFYSSACYKQTFMLMWVWFMLILAILRLSDVFLFVLGIVYRLGIK